MGFLSPRAAWPILKLVREIEQQSEYLNFSSECRIVELDGEENFGDYLARIGVPDYLKVTLGGFLEMTMGRIEDAGAAYMRTYLAEMLLKTDQIYVPEMGAGALAHALAAECGDAIRVSTPVRSVIIRDGVVTGVVVDEGTIEAARGHLRPPRHEGGGHHSRPVG